VLLFVVVAAVSSSDVVVLIVEVVELATGAVCAPRAAKAPVHPATAARLASSVARRARFAG
jgi:hypothetical protein